MYLKHLVLINFRNYRHLALTFPCPLTVLQGPNAQGKTNLLEAVYLLATSKSPHAQQDRQLVAWEAGQEPLPFARLQADVEKGGGNRRLELIIAPIQQANGQMVFRKQIRIDGVPKRALDLVGELKVVMFWPEDIDLIAGSPAGRRRYLDMVLCQVDRRYCAHLMQYAHVLERRNRLLRLLRDSGGDPAQLAFWDERLAEHGGAILVRRWAATARLAGLAADFQRRLTGGGEMLAVRYQTSLAQVAERMEDLTPADAAGAMRKALQAQRPREIAAGQTLLGPHRDDLIFTIDGYDLRAYGSRGQQRTVALALKLAEVEFIRTETGETPLLLLDDLMSELDEPRRCYMADLLAGAHQAIITATDLRDFPEAFLAQSVVWHVRQGTLIPHEKWVNRGQNLSLEHKEADDADQSAGPA
ncbi:MAG: DNA replication/repair protein RecF [Anaerolineae bacterium]